MLGDLTFLVDSVVDLKDQAEDRAEALSKKDKATVEAFADSLDALHKTLVVTEGGWISGQEQLRERLGALYGDVSFYDGRPTDSQIERMARLKTELEAKEAEFETTVKKIDSVNRVLARRDLEPLTRMTLDQWQAQQDGSGGSSSMASLVALGLMFAF
jgi:hypothetical protein